MKFLIIFLILVFCIPSLAHQRPLLCKFIKNFKDCIEDSEDPGKFLYSSHNVRNTFINGSYIGCLASFIRTIDMLTSTYLKTPDKCNGLNENHYCFVEYLNNKFKCKKGG